MGKSFFFFIFSFFHFCLHLSNHFVIRHPIRGARHLVLCMCELKGGGGDR
jgi:hypothetical protein